jgi:acyl-coenzyme A synthetase/AMP-(fatty) acid ligase
MAQEMHITGSPVFDQIMKVAGVRPETLAIEGLSGDRCTYREFLGLTNSIARALRRQGVRPGNCIALCCRSSTRYAAAITAVCKIGACYLPIPSSFSAQTVASALEVNRVALVVLDREGTEVPNLYQVTTFDALLRAKADDNRTEQLFSHGLMPFRRMWSSGSTGRAKSIVWSQDKFVDERLRWIEAVGLRAEDRYFCIHTLDVAHATDLHLFSALFSGATCIINDIECSPDQIWGHVSGRNPTVLSALPEHFRAWIRYCERHGNRDYGSIRLAMCGGTFVNSQLSDDVRSALGFHISQIYGSTEFGLAMISKPGEAELRSISGVSARIAGAGRTHGDRIGQLVLTSPFTSDGYFDDPEATDALLRDGEFWTGDLAMETENLGFLLAGRASEAFVLDDCTVTTSIIDQLAQTALKPCNCATVILSSRSNGRIIARIFVDAEQLSDDSLIVDLEKKLEHEKPFGPLDVRIIPILEFPYTDVGKPDKQSLRRKVLQDEE